MFSRIRQLVQPAITRYGLEQGLQAAQVASRWRAVAQRVLGPQFPVPAAISFKNGVLWIELSSSVVAQEIQLSKLQLLDALEEEFSGRVQDIRFRLPQREYAPGVAGRAY
jgi:hypothetical protein